MSFDTLSSFIFASAVLALTPGPDNIFVLTQSALYGRLKGFFVTLGLCTGLVAHTVAVSLGVAAVFQTSPFAFSLLKVIGACYLIYLAWGALSASQSKLEGSAPPLSAIKLYLRGIVMNVTNPKVAIFFFAFLPQFANAESDPLWVQMIILGCFFSLATLVVFSSIALLSGSLRVVIDSKPGFQKAIHLIAALVFVGLALHLILSSVP